MPATSLRADRDLRSHSSAGRKLGVVQYRGAGGRNVGPGRAIDPTEERCGGKAPWIPALSSSASYGDAGMPSAEAHWPRGGDVFLHSSLSGLTGNEYHHVDPYSNHSGARPPEAFPLSAATTTTTATITSSDAPWLCPPAPIFTMPSVKHSGGGPAPAPGPSPFDHSSSFHFTTSQPYQEAGDRYNVHPSSSNVGPASAYSVGRDPTQGYVQPAMYHNRHYPPASAAAASPYDYQPQLPTYSLPSVPPVTSHFSTTQGQLGGPTPVPTVMSSVGASLGSSGVSRRGERMIPSAATKRRTSRARQLLAAGGQGMRSQPVAALPPGPPCSPIRKRLAQPDFRETRAQAGRPPLAPTLRRPPLVPPAQITDGFVENNGMQGDVNASPASSSFHPCPRDVQRKRRRTWARTPTAGAGSAGTPISAKQGAFTPFTTATLAESSAAHDGQQLSPADARDGAEAMAALDQPDGPLDVATLFDDAVSSIAGGQTPFALRRGGKQSGLAGNAAADTALLEHLSMLQYSAATGSANRGQKEDEPTTEATIAAVIDNRAGEVGVALLNVETFRIQLTQFSDSSTFFSLIGLLGVRRPSEVIVPKTLVSVAASSELVRRLQHAPVLEQVILTGVSRAAFSETNGLQKLQSLVSLQDTLQDVTPIDRYLCCAAAHAVLSYAEHLFRFTFAPGTLFLNFFHLDQFVAVDRRTILTMKLVPAYRERRSTAVNAACTKGVDDGARSLFSVLNYTATAMGRRALISNLVQPSRDIATLEARLAAVGFLQDNSHMLRTLRRQLRLVRVDVDKLLGRLTHDPINKTTKTAIALVKSVADLQSLLEVLRQMLLDWEGLAAAVAAQDGAGQRHGAVGGSGSNGATFQTPIDQGPAGGAGIETTDPCGGASPESTGSTATVADRLRACMPVLLAEAVAALHNDEEYSSVMSAIGGVLDFKCVARMMAPTNAVNQDGGEENAAPDPEADEEGVAVDEGGGGQGAGETRTRQSPVANKTSAPLHSAVGSLLQSELQIYYAVKPGISGVLDVARLHYSDTVEQLHAETEHLKKTYNISSLQLRYHAKRGYFLSADVKASGKTLAEHGDVFLQQLQKKTKVLCTTREVQLLQARARDARTEILQTTDQVVTNLVTQIRASMSSLHAAAQALGLLDYLAALATYGVFQSNVGATCRPALLTSNDASMSFVQSVHPLMMYGGAKEAAGRTKVPATSSVVTGETRPPSVVPNTIHLHKPSGHLSILTGPNASGKTTLLHQTVLLTVMAHTGGFLPCESASVPLVDGIYTRMATDCAAEDMSSFVREVTETSSIVRNASPSSLVILDELGRGTSDKEGTAFVWSVCEELAARKSYAIVATHFVTTLPRLALYDNNNRSAADATAPIPVNEAECSPLELATCADEGVQGVTNTHLTVAVLPGQLRFNYALQHGTCSVDRYGLKLAKMLGLPDDVVCNAEDLAARLSVQQAAVAPVLSAVVDGDSADVHGVAAPLATPSIQLATIVYVVRSIAAVVAELSSENSNSSSSSSWKAAALESITRRVAAALHFIPCVAGYYGRGPSPATPQLLHPSSMDHGGEDALQYFEDCCPVVASLVDSAVTGELPVAQADAVPRPTTPNALLSGCPISSIDTVRPPSRQPANSNGNTTAHQFVASPSIQSSLPSSVTSSPQQSQDDATQSVDAAALQDLLPAAWGSSPTGGSGEEAMLDTACSDITSESAASDSPCTLDSGFLCL